MGGGGEVRLEFLDDLDRDTALVDGKFLKYQASTKTFVGADASGETTKTLDSVLGDGNSSTKGMSVGILTATNAFITGDLNVTGDIVYDEVTGRNINITGIATAATINVGTATTIDGSGVNVTGIITATTFSGNITGNVTGNATGLSGSPDIAVTNITAGIATVSSALYIPQYTTTARDAATFAEGAIIYNTTTKKINFYDGTNFVELPGVTLGLGMGVF